MLSEVEVVEATVAGLQWVAVVLGAYVVASTAASLVCHALRLAGAAPARGCLRRRKRRHDHAGVHARRRDGPTRAGGRHAPDRHRRASTPARASCATAECATAECTTAACATAGCATARVPAPTAA